MSVRSNHRVGRPRPAVNLARVQRAVSLGMVAAPTGAA